MFEDASPRSRLLAAAMKLAAERPWGEIALAEIAREASVPLAEVRTAIRSKAEIVPRFVRAVDDAVAARIDVKPETSDGPRDRLFDTLMTRFELLTPYRAALKSILAETGPLSPPVPLPVAAASQAWMLNASGIVIDGALGSLKVMGLTGLYGRVFRVFLDDDEPDLARTMAALDRELRMAERAVTTVEDVCGGLWRLGKSFWPGANRPPDRSRASDPPPAADPAQPTLF